MKIIHILCHHLHVKMFLKLGNGIMGGVRLNREQLLAAYIVKLHHQSPISFQRLGRTDILNTIIRPQTIGIAECGDTTIGTHARTCKNHNLLHINMLIFFFLTSSHVGAKSPYTAPRSVAT